MHERLSFVTPAPAEFYIFLFNLYGIIKLLNYIIYVYRRQPSSGWSLEFFTWLLWLHG